MKRCLTIPRTHACTRTPAEHPIALCALCPCAPCPCAQHLENRWHRQFLGGALRCKQMLLLWCERTLRRCWLAWGAHMVRVRMERETQNEVRQLAYALRVASLSRHSALVAAVETHASVSAAGPSHAIGTPAKAARSISHALREHTPLGSYLIRRAW